MIPPGDDCALWRAPSPQLLTVDGLAEGTHFRFSWASRVQKILGMSLGRALGWKLVGSALSDLAAMGNSTHRWALLFVAAPGDLPYQFLLDFSFGINAACRQFSCSIVGGDTVKGKTFQAAASIGATLVGRRAVRRGGARSGDLVAVCGFVGDAALGLQVLEGQKRLPVKKARPFVEKFFRPVPLFKEGSLLAATPLVSAMMDLSDPLPESLSLMASASGVGMDIDVDKIPLSRQTAAFLSPEKALKNSGEDYGLLFTVRPAGAAALARKMPFHVIGRVRAGKGVGFFKNSRRIAEPTAFTHFS